MAKFNEYIPDFKNLPQNSIIRFTKKEDLQYLMNPSGFRSYDNGGSKAGLSRIMTHIGKTANQSFTSAAVCPNLQSYNKLQGYGEALLILNKSKIENDTYIFNGDFQDLSFKADKDENVFKNNIAWCKMSDTSFFQFITTRYNNVEVNNETYNCLVGSYFECRIFRPIKIEDVQDIYVPPLANEKKSGTLKQYLLKLNKPFNETINALFPWDKKRK